MLQLSYFLYLPYIQGVLGGESLRVEGRFITKSSTFGKKGRFPKPTRMYEEIVECVSGAHVYV